MSLVVPTKLIEVACCRSLLEVECSVEVASVSGLVLLLLLLVAAVESLSMSSAAVACRRGAAVVKKKIEVPV